METSDRVSIRVAGPEDAAAVHAMIVELAELLQSSLKVDSNAADIADALSGDNPAIHALLAERDRQLVGVAVFFLTYSTWRGSRGVYLQDIFVAASERGTGLGRRLLGRIASWGRDHQASHLRLSVDARNVTAQSFYDKLGLVLRDDELIFDVAGAAFTELGSAL